MMLVTYAATCAQVAVELRSPNGAYWRSQLPELQTAAVVAPPLMIPWPFLFCQKPIVTGPVLACSRTIGMLSDAVASGASFEDAVATLTTFPPAWNSAGVTVCCP